jgi:hypothetical protein
MDQQLERKRISQRLLIDVLVIVISLVIIGIAIGFGIGGGAPGYLSSGRLRQFMNTDCRSGPILINS